MSRAAIGNTVVALTSSLLVHGMMLAAAASAGRPEPARAPDVTDIELDDPVASPVLPEPSQPEPDTHATEEPAPRAPDPPSKTPLARATAPAAAGRTLTAPDEPSAPTSLADFSMVQGDALSYGGGTTASAPGSTQGASSHDRPGQPGAPASAPVRRVAPERDLSRAARPLSLDWDCSRLFPPGSSTPDSASVIVAVSVGEHGRARAVSIVRDPGHGFGAAARACALAQRYVPALDRDGRAIAATTAPITIFFTR